jgi:hypothetical protein
MRRPVTKRTPRTCGRLNDMMECHDILCNQTKASPKHHRHRGIALAWTAIVITAVLLLVGLSIDTAKLCYNVHQMQNATDAAALAGARIVKTSSPDDTRQFTHDLAFANKAEQLDVFLRMDPQPEPFTADENSYDILIGRWVRYNRTFIPTLDAPNAVQAVARRTAALGATNPALRAIRYIFGPLAGVPTADAATLSIGWCYNSGGAGLICLSDSATPGLYVSGNADLDIDGGGIHVNSTASGHNSSDGSWLQGSSLVDAGFINVVGGIDPPPDSSDWVHIFQGGTNGVNGFSVSDMTTIPAPQHIDDPLAAQMLAQGDPYVDPLTGTHLDLPLLIENGTFPTFNIPTVGGTGTTVTLAPGYYPNGISLSNGDKVILQPTSASGAGTIFIFGGGTNKNNSNVGLYMTAGTLIGHGVTCYVTYNFATHVYGLTRLTGGAVDLLSPGDWQNKLNIENGDQFDVSLVNGLNGIAIWQDPTMIDPKTGLPPDVHLNGNADFFISGTLYFPDPIHVVLEGNLGQAGNQILCGSADILGKAVINVNYDTRNQGFSSKVCLVK